MVRRAATEALCNLAANASMTALLQKDDKLPLWLGLCEECAVEIEPETEDKNADDADGNNKEDTDNSDSDSDQVCVVRIEK